MVGNLVPTRLSCLCFCMCWSGIGWLVCVYLASFSSSWLLCALGGYGNGSIGCTNNNYASREKCKKCGQPKEVAAMPAIAIPGALPTYSHYFSRSQGGLDQRMALGSVGNVAATPSFPLGPNWSGGELERYGVHQSSPWPLGGNYGTAPPSSNQSSTVPKGWRNGDWICSCGFHNYASRAEVWICDLRYNEWVVFLIQVLMDCFGIVVWLLQ